MDYLYWVLAVIASSEVLDQVIILFRSYRTRSVDGWTTKTAALGVSSYVSWLMLSLPLGIGFVLGALVQLILSIVWLFRLEKENPGQRRWWWFVSPVALAVLAWVSLPLLALVVIVVDLWWYAQVISDIIRSRSAEAVPIWAWTLSIVAHIAWIISAYGKEAVSTLVVNAVFTVLAVISLIVTVAAHRRSLHME